jgi:hypothetical protein
MADAHDEPKAVPFGAHFEVDETNRLDVLKKQEALPDYVQFSRGDLRDSLKISNEEWPQAPESFSGVEDLFSKAKAAVGERWRSKTLPLLANKCEQWLSQIPDTDGNRKLRSILKNASLLDEKMEMNYYEAVADLRSMIPEAWRTLLMASSERQLAEVALFRRWTRSLSEESAKKTGLSKPELELFADIPAFLGKYIDQGYLKQLEQADRPGGSSPSSFPSEVRGADRIYDIQREEGGNIEHWPFVAAFPFELKGFSKLVLHLKSKVEGMLAKGLLPKNYTEMPVYLGRMAELYSSPEASPQVLADRWGKELAEDANRLSREGCPMVLIPQSTAAVANDANKVDIELRLGLRTPQVEALEKEAGAIRKSAQSIADQYPQAVKEPAKIPSVTLTYQPFAFGPNLYWITRGESPEGKILSHVNSVAEVAKRQEVPLLEKMFEVGKIDPEAYSEWAKMETILHELAHSILAKEDETVSKRTGTVSESTLVEELKADSVNMLLLKKVIEDGEVRLDIENQFRAKLGAVCDYLANKPDTQYGRYYFNAVKIAHDLLKAGAIEKIDSGKYAIRDARKGIDIVAGIGQEVLALYADLNTTPETVKAYADKMVALREDPMTQEFITAVRS